MDDSWDAFGHMLSDYVAGTGALEIVERDDGFIGAARCFQRVLTG